MKTVKTKPEFENLAEDEIMKALNDFEDEIEKTLGSDIDDIDDLDDVDFPDIEPESPIVLEVSRLINEYTNRFDEYCENSLEDGVLPEEIFEYEPEIMIERISYEIFMDAVLDAMQESDDTE